MNLSGYLNTLTVKALNVVARDMGLSGYGKLRKAALVTMLESAIGQRAAELSEKVVAFTDVKPVEKAVKTVQAVIPTVFSARKPPVQTVRQAVIPVTVSLAEQYAAESTQDLIDAFRSMVATLHTLRGVSHAKLAVRVQTLGKALKARRISLVTLKPVEGKGRSWRK